MISYKGFRISKNLLTKEQLEQTQKDLTVKPIMMADFDFGNNEFRVFRQNSTHLYVPKFYGLEKFGNEILRDERTGMQISLIFKGQLKPDQSEFIDKVFNWISENDSCVACASTGSGKTIMALNLISKISRKTLIIVHKEFLMNQWIERINQFLPEARIGKIQQDIQDTVDKDIVICMLQSLASREYDSKLFDDFGLSIFDEAHHICSKTFSQVLFKIATKKMIGLSATPIRKDGLTKVLTWFSGPIIQKEQLNKEIDNPEVIMIPAKFSEEIQIKYGISRKVNIPDLITKISLDPLRNSQIADLVIKYSPDRKILCLSERRQHCYDIQSELLKKEFKGTIGIYIGGMTNEELESSNKCSVIIGTYQSISEGYDNSSLDTLILCTSKSDIVQSVGRILRKKNKNHPLIIDICDDTLRVGQIRARRKFYKSQKFNLVIEKKEQESEESEESGLEFRSE